MDGVERWARIGRRCADEGGLSGVASSFSWELQALTCVFDINQVECNFRSYRVQRSWAWMKLALPDGERKYEQQR